MIYAPCDISKITDNPEELSRKGRQLLRTYAITLGAIEKTTNSLKAFDAMPDLEKAALVIAAKKKYEESQGAPPKAPKPAPQPTPQPEPQPAETPEAASATSPPLRRRPGRPRKEPVPEVPAAAEAPAPPPPMAVAAPAPLSAQVASAEQLDEVLSKISLLQDIGQGTETHAAKAAANTLELYRMVEDLQQQVRVLVHALKVVILQQALFAESVSGGNVDKDMLIEDAMVDHESIDFSKLTEGKA